MSNSFLNKTIIIIIYVLIIIMIPLFLDYLFRLTVRKNRKNKILELAKFKSNQTSKPIIVFNDRYHGVVINLDDENGNEEFTGDIIDIVNKMADNSCILIVSESLEYINDDLLSDTIKLIDKISGGDCYFINIEKNSPRVFWDYKIINIMDKSFYLPDSNITWEPPNNLQYKIQFFYSYVFKIIPYKFFSYDPVIKV